LTWEARNAATVRIEPELGEVNATSGTRQVSPASSVTYQATATGPGGTASDVARITVNIPAPPPATTPPPAPAPTLTIDELFTRNVLPILFDYDQSEIRADQISRLQDGAGWLRQNPNVRFTIEGHADERGSQEYNLALGDRRANAVRQYLVAQGIPANRINVVSYGEERPDCRDTTEDCYQRNRRAAFAMLR
jgi:peptidoglycan-associated lipoprotein